MEPAAEGPGVVLYRVLYSVETRVLVRVVVPLAEVKTEVWVATGVVVTGTEAVPLLPGMTVG